MQRYGSIIEIYYLKCKSDVSGGRVTDPGDGR